MSATRSRHDTPLFLLGSPLLLLACIGCRQDQATTLTPTEVRTARRAYDGSPPVIPHPSLGAACTVCHTKTGKRVPNMAYAPANPHGDQGRLQNCRQCHLFRRGEGLFVESDFVAGSTELARGKRLYPGAPPTIPHSLVMRSNCVACHCTATARPEIRCSHPERVRCVQCHLPQQSVPSFVAVSIQPSLKGMDHVTIKTRVRHTHHDQRAAND